MSSSRQARICGAWLGKRVRSSPTGDLSTVLARDRVFVDMAVPSGIIIVSPRQSCLVSPRMEFMAHRPSDAGNTGMVSPASCRAARLLLESRPIGEGRHILGRHRCRSITPAPLVRSRSRVPRSNRDYRSVEALARRGILLTRRRARVDAHSPPSEEALPCQGCSMCAGGPPCCRSM